MRGLLQAGATFLAVAMSACGSPASAPASPSVGASHPSPAKFDARAIQVEAKAITYLPDQTGGSFHEILVLLKNTSPQVAIDVTGQISIFKSGSLIKSINPTPVNILPGSEGLWEESADLGQPAGDATLQTIITVDGGFKLGPSQPAVIFQNVAYLKGGGGFGSCSISGTVKNTFTQQKDNLQIRVVGLNGDGIATGGFTYVDKVFPGQDATWTVQMLSPSECPPSVGRVLVLPNLGVDKIFNP